MSLLDKILERARALRSLRDKASNRHESEAAARALAALLDKHQIEEASIPAEGGQEPAIDYEPLYTYRRVVAWKMLLARILCTHYGVALYRRPPTRRAPGYACMMAGRPDDIAIVRYMWAWLVAEAVRLLEREGGEGRSYRQSWMTGFVSGIKLQLTEARKVAWSGASSTALAVLTSREQRAHEAASRAATITGHEYEPRSTTDDVRGFFEGQARGRAVSLDETLPAHERQLPVKSE